MNRIYKHCLLTSVLSLSLIVGCGINQTPEEFKGASSGLIVHKRQAHRYNFDLDYLMAHPACVPSEQMGLVGMPFELRVDEQGEPYLEYIGPDGY